MIIIYISSLQISEIKRLHFKIDNHCFFSCIWYFAIRNIRLALSQSVSCDLQFEKEFSRFQIKRAQIVLVWNHPSTSCTPYFAWFQFSFGTDFETV